MDDKEKTKLFKEFLFKNKIMIVDRSSASRQRLAKTLNENDAKTINIHMYSKYEEAVAALDTIKPALILSDYHLGDGSGFDLFRIYREKNTPESKAAVLILITSNISQSAVAKAAEEDVDSFIIKPYTIQSLTGGIMNAFMEKLHPTEYMIKIEEGKKVMESGDYDKAMVIFESAKTLSPKPSLACFYIGQANYFKKIKEQAKSDFKEGLTFNNIHFKCQIGLYDIYMKDKLFDEAYEVAKNIAKYFPSNPDRLNSIVRLAVVTKNFQDMNFYYEIFKSLEMREKETIKYICAGLYVSGKYYMLNKQEDEAINLFNKIAISAGGETKFYRAMIESLIDNNLVAHAEKILLRFDSDEKLTEDFAISDFLLKAVKEKPGLMVGHGIKLFYDGVTNLSFYKMLLTIMHLSGSMEKSQEVLAKATETYPEHKDEFHKIINPK
ncbi:MAG: response regulator [Bacteriovoracaceae bacterium]|nr:response regulator [Bacteriovoracaceae bacterium]